MHDMSSMLAPLDWHALLTHWSLRPGWLVVAVLMLALYVLGLRAARRQGSRAVHPARAGCFVLGVVLLYVTVASGVAAYGEALFWMHMVEHLLLVMVVPTLLVLGSPITVARAATAGPARERFDRALDSRPVRVVTNPVVGFAVYGVVIIGTHLTSFMDTMMGSPGLADVERVLYLVGGYLLMLALVGNEPIPTRLSYGPRIFLSVTAMLPDTIVGIVLLQSEVDLFPVMEGMRPGWAPSPLQDMHTGGSIMWAIGDLLMMLVSIGLVIALISDPQRDRLLGTWLENVRRSTFDTRVGNDLGDREPLAQDADIDEAEDALSAYNRMLERLNAEERGGR